MAKLLFQGHGSFRITTVKDVVIYVDPFAGTGYDLPADIILVTHQHGDHNQIQMPAKKESCIVLQNLDMLLNGEYKCHKVGDIAIQSVPAYNKNHDKGQSVGYILTFDGIKLYAAGDTSTTNEMKEFHAYNLDYALLPIDGVYNMDPMEASDCGDMIAAKHVIPIHMKPGALFDEEQAARFTAKHKLIIKAGEEISL